MSEELDYYKVGNIDNIVVSSSMLNALDPDSNGSPQKVLKFFNEDFKPNSAMINGTILHKWAEDKEAFKVADFNMPSEMAQEWVKDVHKHMEGIFDEQVTIAEYKEVLEDKILKSKNNLGIYTNIKKEEKILEKWISLSCDKYYSFLCAASNGKIPLTAAQKELLDNVSKSINSKQVVKDLLFDNSSDFSNTIHLNEHDFYFSYKREDQEPINCKAKVDIVRINPDNKVIMIIDLKTTSDSPYNAAKLIKSRKTYRQIAFYSKAVKSCIKKMVDIPIDNTWIIKHYVIYAQTKSPFDCNAVELNSTWIFKGHSEISDLMDLVVHHNKNGWVYTKNEFDNNGIFKIPNYEDV